MSATLHREAAETLTQDAGLRASFEKDKRVFVQRFSPKLQAIGDQLMFLFRVVGKIVDGLPRVKFD